MKKLRVDVAALTNIPTTLIEQLEHIATESIAHTFFESLLDEETCIIDIGVGKLTIQYIDDYLTYKYTPSLELQEYLKDIIDSKKDILIEEIEESLSAKITKTYKELF